MFGEEVRPAESVDCDFLLPVLSFGVSPIFTIILPMLDFEI